MKNDAYSRPNLAFAEFVTSPQGSDFERGLRASVIYAMRRTNENGKLWLTEERNWKANPRDVLRQFNAALAIHGKPLSPRAKMDEKKSIKHVRGRILEQTNLMRDMIVQRFDPRSADETKAERGLSWLRDLYKKARSAETSQRREDIHTLLQLIKLIRDETAFAIRDLNVNELTPSYRRALSEQLHGIHVLVHHASTTLELKDLSKIPPSTDWQAYAQNTKIEVLDVVRIKPPAPLRPLHEIPHIQPLSEEGKRYMVRRIVDENFLDVQDGDVCINEAREPVMKGPIRTPNAPKPRTSSQEVEMASIARQERENHPAQNLDNVKNGIRFPTSSHSKSNEGFGRFSASNWSSRAMRCSR